jgi:hypothetical protein
MYFNSGNWQLASKVEAIRAESALYLLKNGSRCITMLGSSPTVGHWSEKPEEASGV